MITRTLLNSSQLLIRRTPLTRLRYQNRVPSHLIQAHQLFVPHLAHPYVTKTEADDIVEELQELYATARDEFEIAAEETEKKTVYAADDRAAAKEEFEKLKSAFDTAVKNSAPEVAAEIKTRVGQRIRELEGGVQRMEEMALQD